MSIPLQVSEWSDVAHFFNDTPSEQEIVAICSSMVDEMDDESESDELTEDACEYESLYMDEYADRGGEPERY